MANLLAHEWRIGLKDYKEAQKGIAKGTRKMKKIFCAFLRSLLCLLRSLFVITVLGRGPGGLDGRWTEAYHPLPLERRSPGQT
jgi:hypothetical protein